MVVLLISTLILGGLVISLLAWHHHKESFFRKHRIPFVQSSLVGGSLKDVILRKKSVAEVIVDVYKEAERRNLPCIGVRFLHKNCLVIRDLDLVKRVLVEDFNHFSDRSAHGNPHRDPFGGYNLFMAKNPLWHEMRAKITPVFTTSRMRKFFEEIHGIGEKLNKKLLHEIDTEKVLTLKDLNGAYTTDVYASCSFGISVNFLDDPQSVFGRTALEMFNFKLFRALEFGAFFVAPELSNLLPLFFFSKAGSKYLKTMLSAVMEERKRKGITRNDLMDVIMKIKSVQENRSSGGGDDKTQFSDDMLLAQSVIFFIAGFETTSTALTHTLYELSRNPEIQVKLKKEISDHYEKHGELTYDNLADLKYLSMVCNEVFRLYPAFSFLSRECTPDNGRASYSLLPEMAELPKGLPIYIPTYALHRDEAYFPDAEKFRPERFDADDSNNEDNEIPKGAYLPFGLGPRHCLAQRLAYVVMKIGLVNILRCHHIEKCNETPENISPHNLAVLIVPNKDILVRVKKD